MDLLAVFSYKDLNVIILSVGIKYYVRDPLCDVINYAWPIK